MKTGLTTYNVYCDESCHLERDHHEVMVLGAVWCPLPKTREIIDRLSDLRERHGLPRHFEVKWTKVSPAQERFYLDVIDYFFDDDDLHFRGLVVPNKGSLKAAHATRTHDDWYYRLYFNLLKAILDPEGRYRIYLDIKDTRSAEKVRHLQEALNTSAYAFSQRIIERVQTVRSHEVALLQLTDLLIGGIGYKNRGQMDAVGASPAKRALVERVQRRSGYDLTRPTLLLEDKVNLEFWEAA